MKDKKIIYVVSIIVIFFLGCGTMFAVLKTWPMMVTENVTKIKKDVTVTDAGIADAVEKVYDAVGFVATYKDEEAIASGSGFIFRQEKDKYYILTNYHVIENGNNVKVTFSDNKLIDTKVVGYNEYADIAVLTFESKSEYAVADIGNSDDLRVGDTVFTVGAPLASEYSGTVTRGIISGLDRLVEVDDYIVNVLQTDASINSGNSGGPLCNSNGEVIGINSLKLVSDGVEGMGFAIPIASAIENANDIVAGVVKENPFIGISMKNIADVMNLFNFQERNYYLMFKDNVEASGVSTGVGVVEVTKGSPADKAGLKAGDIIVKMNDEDIKNVAYLRYNLYKYDSGDTIKIKAYRDGKLKEFSVKLSVNKETS